MLTSHFILRIPYTQAKLANTLTTHKDEILQSQHGGHENLVFTSPPHRAVRNTRGVTWHVRSGPFRGACTHTQNVKTRTHAHNSSSSILCNHLHTRVCLYTCCVCVIRSTKQQQRYHGNCLPLNQVVGMNVEQEQRLGLVRRRLGLG